MGLRQATNSETVKCSTDSIRQPRSHPAYELRAGRLQGSMQPDSASSLLLQHVMCTLLVQARTHNRTDASRSGSRLCALSKGLYTRARSTRLGGSVHTLCPHALSTRSVHRSVPCSVPCSVPRSVPCSVPLCPRTLSNGLCPHGLKPGRSTSTSSRPPRFPKLDFLTRWRLLSR